MTITTTRPRQPRRTYTPLDDEFKGRNRRGEAETTDARSLDGVWCYDRPEQRGAWRVTHTPTGMVTGFTALPKARRWTASPGAVPALRVVAAYNATNSRNPVEATIATRQVLIFDGLLLPDGADVDARCTCGGFLSQVARRWTHVDTCVEDLTGSGCDERTTHRTCLRPEAVQCLHIQCVRANDLNAEPCTRGHDACCGCCHERG